MLNNFLNYIFSLNRKIKVFIQLCFDASLIFISFFLAMTLRLNHINFLNNDEFFLNLALLIFLSLITYYKLNFYKAVIRFISGKFLKNVFLGVFFQAFIWP